MKHVMCYIFEISVANTQVEKLDAFVFGSKIPRIHVPRYTKTITSWSHTQLLISAQARGPAEFKHINKRRKRN
jgi:hypothetical protein